MKNMLKNMLKTSVLVLAQLLYAVVTTDLSKGVTINQVIITSAPTDSAKVGSSIHLTCSVYIVATTAARPISYLFYKGYAKEFLLENVTSTQQNSKFTIKSARPSHTGYYLCAVEVGGKTADSDSLYMEVKGQLQTPQLTVYPTELIVGNHIMLLCHADEEIPPIIFVFHKYKNGHLTRLLENKETSKNHTIYKLKVGEATDQAYRCSLQGKDSVGNSNLSEVVNVTVQDPFSSHQFTNESQSRIFVGDELIIKCAVQMKQLTPSDIKLELTIVKDTIPLTTNVNGSLEAKISKTANASDSGEYLCNAKWQESFKIVKLQMDVAVPVSKPILSSTSIHGLVGQGHRYNLTCAVPGGSWPITYTFYKEATGRPLHQMNLNVSEAVYSIPSAQTSQSGKYFCNATNSAGERTHTERSLDINIDVKVPVSNPKLRLVPSTATYEIGKHLSFECHSTNGTPPITYELFLKKRLIDSVKMSNMEPAIFHTLINKTEDGGEYKCKAGNEIPKLSAYSTGVSFKVTVAVSTPQLSPLLNSTNVNLGDNVTLHCITSTGTLPITYTLYRSHSRLAAISTAKAQPAVFHVTIKSSEHYGYTCTAENQISSQSSNTIEFRILSHAFHQWPIYVVVACLLIVVICLVVFLCWRAKHQKGERYKEQNPHIQGLSQTDSYSLIEGTYEEKDYVNILASEETGSASGSGCEEQQYINVKRKMKAPKMENSCPSENNVIYTEINFASTRKGNVQQEEATVYARIDTTKL